MATYFYGENAKLNFPGKKYSVAKVEKTIDAFLNKQKTSKYFGVVRNKVKRRWTGHVRTGGKRFSRLFITEEEAAEFVDIALVQTNNESHPLNFPDKRDYYRSVSLERFEKRAFGKLKKLGIGFDKVNKKYTAYAFYRGRRYWCGRYESMEEAQASIDKKDKELKANDLVV